MASNIRINRVCEQCGQTFEARTTVTRFCSDPCAKRAYKARQRQQRIEASDAETRQTLERDLVELQAKDFLSVEDVCRLFGVSRTTVWRLCKTGKLRSVKIGRKRFIKRSAIDKLFEQ